MSHATRKTCLALLGVLGVFGSGAYSVHALYARGGGARVPAPSIVAKPARETWRTSARFAYTDSRRGARFQCSLDGSRWTACTSPSRYRGPLAGGRHTFRVRALSATRRRAYGGPATFSGSATFSRPASYTWLVDLRPPAPYIARHPTDPTNAHSASFAFTDGEPHVSFQCSVDASPWRACSSPFSRRGLSSGEHRFLVRATDPPAHPSRATRFDWRVTQPGGETLPNGEAQLPGASQPGSYPQPGPGPPPAPSFSIGAGEIVGGPLYPGAAPLTIALTLSNPNDVLIFVTSLSVTVPSGPPGCDPATNVGVAQSDVSSLAPVKVPAHSSVTLPAQGHTAPTIQLLDLPVNQDACQNARFPLSFTGSAHS